MRVLSDNITDAIFVKDRSGRLIFANPATLKTIGRDLSSALGCTNEELFPNVEDAASMSINDEAVMASGQAQHLEQTVHTADMTRTYYVSKSPWRNKYGEIMGIVGISTDITDRKNAENALKQHEAELEELVARRTAEVTELIGHLESTREEEKRAIARELHDDLGSALTALNMHMAIAFKKMSEDPALAERVAQIKHLLNSVTATTRRIQNGLRPDKLDIFGIKTTLVEQALEFQNYTSVACRTNLPDEDISYPSQVEISLFRIVQEALNNVAKHAHATQVDIILDDNEDEVSLTIRDNGVGISEDQKKNYQAVHGLRGMRERAAYLGGRIEITSAPDRGTKINVTFPKTAMMATARAASA
jgi:PAS domain S-box-containing protein